MKLSKDRKTGFEGSAIVESDEPLMLEKLPPAKAQFTAHSKVRHPRKGKRAK